jgi:hypothetical protein
LRRRHSENTTSTSASELGGGRSSSTPKSKRLSQLAFETQSYTWATALRLGLFALHFRRDSCPRTFLSLHLVIRRILVLRAHQPELRAEQPAMSMDSYGVRRSDTTKGPPLRILSLGMTWRDSVFLLIS